MIRFGDVDTLCVSAYVYTGAHTCISPGTTSSTKLSVKHMHVCERTNTQGGLQWSPNEQ